MNLFTRLPALLVAAAIAFAGSVAAFVLIRQKDFVAHGAPAGQPQQAEAPAAA